MSKLIDLGVRYKSAFGYVANNESEPLRREQFSKDNGITSVGVFSNNSSFEELTIKKENGEAIRFGSMMFQKNDSEIYAPPPMISLSKSKKLIITEIDGSDAEVVERYGDKSWDVKFQGLLIDMVNHEFPKSKVITLNEFFDYNAPFAVESEMFDAVNIRSVYFTDVEIGGVAGYADTMQFSISARSIRPVEFFFVKNN